MKNRKHIEVCCGTIDDCITAIKMKADRIELNCALELGGLTPSIATLRKVKELTDIPIACMVRPRHKGFYYTQAQYDIMLEDAKILIENGADGIVFGFLDAQGRIDIQRTQEMVEVIGDKEKIFHKAIDETENFTQSLDLLIECGIDRVLTAGLNESLQSETFEWLGEVIKEYHHKIEILLGGGIHEDNIVELLEKTKTPMFHLTAKELKYDSSTRNFKIKNRGLTDYSYYGVSEERLKNIYELIGDTRV